jgi:triacylglycerol lipase
MCIIRWLSLVGGLSGAVWQCGLLCAFEPTPYRVVRNVSYVQRADGQQTADVYLPASEGPVPGVLLVHGGAWMAGNKNHSAWHARRLAEHGFAVVSINYRLAPQNPFPAQLEDCQAALHWMARQSGQYAWKTEKLAAYGYSAGGHLVCLLGMMQSQSEGAEQLSPPVRLKAIVAGGAPCDFCDEPLGSERLVFWLGATRQESPQVYRDASPTSFVTPNAPAVFFFHGQHDRVVPLANPTRLFDRLRQQGVPTQMHVVPDAGHVKAYLDPQAFDQAVRFLNRQLCGDAQE